MRRGGATEEKDTDLSNQRPAPRLRLFYTVEDPVQREEQYFRAEGGRSQDFPLANMTTHICYS